MRAMTLVLLLISAGSADAKSLRDQAAEAAEHVVGRGLPSAQPSTSEHVGRILLGLAAMTTLCDFGGTLWAAEHHWEGRQEVGLSRVLIGSQPSVTAVTAYFISLSAIGYVVSTRIPSSLRLYYFGVISALEGKTLVGNLGTTPGICGVGGRSTR